MDDSKADQSYGEPNDSRVMVGSHTRLPSKAVTLLSIS